MSAKIIEIIRIVGIMFAFFLGYLWGKNPAQVLHILVPLLVLSVSGLTGIQSLFLGDESATEMGWKKGNPYQKEVGFALLSYAAVAVIVFFAGWGLYAEITVLFASMLFFIMSGSNHIYETIVKKNFKWQNVLHGLLMLILVASLYPPVASALSGSPGCF